MKDQILKLRANEGEGRPYSYPLHNHLPPESIPLSVVRETTGFIILHCPCLRQ